MNAPAWAHKQLLTMGKQTSIIQFKGKLGNLVGFRNANAKTPNENFVRQKAESVANPKTYNQATQRSKITPAQRFYDAFVSVLNHAFIPRGRASKNRNRFLSLAMSNPNIPWVERKQNLLPVNCNYQVSEGSLGIDGLVRASAEGTAVAGMQSIVYFPNLQAQIGTTGSAVRALTVAQFTEKILAGNPNLIEGMELTFMAILVSKADISLRSGVHFSVVLNSGDTLTTIGDIIGSDYELIDTGTSHALAIAATNAGRFNVACAAAIVSSRTTSSWKYTNSFMAMSAWAASYLAGDVEQVITSYMSDASAANSELILQQADNNPSAGTVRPLAGSNEAFTVRNAPQGATYNHTTAATVLMSDGTTRVVTDQNGRIRYYNGTSFEPVYMTYTDAQGQNEDIVTLAMTTWADNPTISEQEAARANFTSSQS